MKWRLVFVLFAASASALVQARDLMVPTGDSFRSNWDRVRFDHVLFDAVLRDHVDAGGLIDYFGIEKDERLREYLYRLANTDPAGLPDSKARLAFWINAYNALVIHGVLEALPDDRSAWSRFNVLEVKDRGFTEPGKGFFRGFRFVVGGHRYALDEIEHGVLLQREVWLARDRSHYESVGPDSPDPRIHFALVCAAKGCVKLRRGAYTARAVDKQLDEAISGFVKDTNRIRFDREDRTIHVSQLLDWYGGDLTNPAFTPHAPSVAAFLGNYVSDKDLAKSLRTRSWTLEWIDYDWSLNMQP